MQAFKKCTLRFLGFWTSNSMFFFLLSIYRPFWRDRRRERIILRRVKKVNSISKQKYFYTCSYLHARIRDQHSIVYLNCIKFHPVVSYYNRKESVKNRIMHFSYHILTTLKFTKFKIRIFADFFTFDNGHTTGRNLMKF